MARFRIQGTTVRSVKGDVRVWPKTSFDVLKPDGTSADIYTNDTGGAPQSRPFKSDADGKYDFFVASDQDYYRLVFSIGNSTVSERVYVYASPGQIAESELAAAGSAVSAASATIAAEAAAAQSAASAEGSGPSEFVPTYAAAVTAATGYAEGTVIQVAVDETRSDQTSNYIKDTGEPDDLRFLIHPATSVDVAAVDAKVEAQAFPVESTNGVPGVSYDSIAAGRILETLDLGHRLVALDAADSDPDIDETGSGGAKYRVPTDRYGNVNLLAFGPVTAATFTRALQIASERGVWLYAPAGTYDLSGITKVQPAGDIRIKGDGNSTVFTGSGEILSQLAEGKSAILRDVAFDSFACVVETPSITGGNAFELLEALRCKFTNIDNSPMWNFSGDIPQGVEIVRFNENIVRNSGKADGSKAGLGCRSSYIRSAYVQGNEIEDVGGNFSGKAYGIIIGGLTVADDTSTVISNNRVRSVSNNSTNECNGILALGRSTRVIANSVQEVISTNPSNNDCEGLYVKASYSVLSSNTLINAGGEEGSIILKGSQPSNTVSSFGHDTIVSSNTILFTDNRTRRNGLTLSVIDRTKVFGNIVVGADLGIGIAQGNDLIEIYQNRILDLWNPTNSSVVGISIGSVANVVVRHNYLRDIGRAANVSSIAIYNSGPSATDLKNVVITDNIIERVVSSGTSYAIRLQLNAGTTGRLLDVSRNNISDCDIGILLLSIDGFDTMRLCDNSEVSVSSPLSYSSPMPSGSYVSGNTHEGKPFIELTQGASNNMAQGGFDEYRIDGGGSARSISAFTRMTDGRRIRVTLTDGDVTLSNNSNIVLSGGTNWNPASGGFVDLVNVNGVMYETARVEF